MRWNERWMDATASEAEAAIIRSWEVNAQSWTQAVRSSTIASRVEVTDRAVVAAVMDCRPHRVLDVGCGEGWLARELTVCGAEVLGLDVVPALIERARERGGARFETASYDDLASRQLELGAFDAVVCNFSLLGQESVESLLKGARSLLSTPGRLVVQTLHPVTACGELPYCDGWRAGTWAGFGPEFSDPAPWYFRTLGSWYGMLRRCGFELVECREPTAEAAKLPASVIFICRPEG